VAGSEKPNGTALPSENHALPVPGGPNLLPLNVILASGHPEPGLTSSSSGFGSGGGWEWCAEAAWAPLRRTSRTSAPLSRLARPVARPPLAEDTAAAESRRALSVPTAQPPCLHLKAARTTMPPRKDRNLALPALRRAPLRRCTSVPWRGREGGETSTGKPETRRLREQSPQRHGPVGDVLRPQFGARRVTPPAGPSARPSLGEGQAAHSIDFTVGRCGTSVGASV